MPPKATFTVEAKGVNAAAAQFRRFTGAANQATVAVQGRLARGLSGLSASLSSFRTLLAGAGIYMAGRFAVGTLRASNALQSTENGFKRLTSARGIPDAAGWLQKFSDASDNMASRASIAANATVTMAVNSKLSADNVRKLFEFSRDYADSMDSEFLPMLERVRNAFGGFELETIRRLGLEEEYTKSLTARTKALGSLGKNLDANQKREMQTLSLMDAIREKHVLIGNTAVTAANRITQAGAAWTDFTAIIGKKLEGPAADILISFTAALRASTAAAEKLRGPSGYETPAFMAREAMFGGGGWAERNWGGRERAARELGVMREREARQWYIQTLYVGRAGPNRASPD